ncbi:MAG: RecQ family ATP-dependent DNA helicase, partial [Caldilineaceae bacterium]|nr:RecQ family ATP-dependent DNA helicase [Caldilineaceae bacterium]
MTDTSPSLLNSISLTRSQVTALPPEVRDQLLDYLLHWGEAEEVLALLDELLLQLGPILRLLDYQAEALFLAARFADALEVVERRQRRSTTIASQALEARCLLAAGHADAARAVADDIGAAHLLSVPAQTAAAQVYTTLGDFAQAQALLEAFLARRPGNLSITLAVTDLARQSGETAALQAYSERLGAGIPAGITDLELAIFRTLQSHLGRQESAQAAELELERRRQLQHQALADSLSPFTRLEAADLADLAQIYRSRTGPEAIPVSRDEKRTVMLAAARHFGFTQLRPAQTEIIAAVLRGESILAVLPTGAGKSLCYQLPALLLPQATLVISPLIALMKDQVESLPAAAQAKATFINSSLSDDEIQSRLAGVAQGNYKLIYAAPERLRQRSFLRALRDAGIGLFVVDEAHCVSMWGHDFRPDYLFIQEARHELGTPAALAMTATAPPRVRDEILDHIRQDVEVEGGDRDRGAGDVGAKVVSLDIFRFSLHLSALRFHNDDEKLAALLKFVGETPGSGIVYANSRRKCEALAIKLQGMGVSAAAYHAGLADRGQVQDDFMAGRIRVVVATVAFGMGIDKSDIRFIAHFHPPRSLESYYQEAGRAGRDDKPAQCVLFYSNNDWSNLRRWGKADQLSVDFLVRVYNALATQVGVGTVEIGKIEGGDREEETGRQGEEETGYLLGAVNGRRLEQVVAADETTVRVAISQLERAGLLSRTFDVPQELEITLPAKAKPAPPEDADLRRILKALALKPGKTAVFQSKDIANYMGWDLFETEGALLTWQSEGRFMVRGSKRAMLIEMPHHPLDVRERLERLQTNTVALSQRRIDDIVGYATAESCRHGNISAHFGSVPRSTCTVCDNCTGIRPDLPMPEEPAHPPPDDADIEPMIIDCLISLPKPVGRSGLARILAGSLRAPVQANECRHHGRLYTLGESTIMEYTDSLIEDSRLRQYERGGYPVLAATMRGRTEADTWLQEHPELASPTAGPAEPVEAEEIPEEEAETYTGLQKALWLWRRRSADEQGQPAYVIMSNKTMLAIAEARPQSLEALGDIPGMGENRIEYYGGIILDLIQLNPAQEGDEALFEAQHAAGPRQSAQATTPTTPAMSPVTEKRIFLKLQELRQKIAVTDRSKPYLIANNGLLKAIAAAGPGSAQALESLLGFRSSGLLDYTEQILEMVA